MMHDQVHVLICPLAAFLRQPLAALGAVSTVVPTKLERVQKQLYRIVHLTTVLNKFVRVPRAPRGTPAERWDDHPACQRPGNTA